MLTKKLIKETKRLVRWQNFLQQEVELKKAFSRRELETIIKEVKAQ